jgi:cytochrome c553
VRIKRLKKLYASQYCGALVVCYLSFGATSFAQTDPRQQRGLLFATTNCARCHSIDKVTTSPLKQAPPFRELHKRYPVESLEEARTLSEANGYPTSLDKKRPDADASFD